VFAAYWIWLTRRPPGLATARALWGFVLLPFVLFAILQGGGPLPFVPATRWGGLLLTLVATLATFASALPLGLLLALGRRRAAKLPPWPITVALGVFIAIMAVDGLNSMFVDMFLPHLYTPQNWLRTLTGIGMGTAMAVLLLLILNISLRRDHDDQQRIVGNWLELGGALLINGLVLLAIYGNIEIMYWPIAVAAWLGIIGVLYCVNLLLAALFMRYEGIVTRVAQLAKPATFALVFTLIELGALSMMRFWLEAQGLIVGA
jgi:ABC-type amino acid transport system permease subunit